MTVFQLPGTSLACPDVLLGKVSRDFWWSYSRGRGRLQSAERFSIKKEEVIKKIKYINVL